MGKTGRQRAELGHPLRLLQAALRIPPSRQHHLEEGTRCRRARVQQLIEPCLRDRKQQRRVGSRPDRRITRCVLEQRHLTDHPVRLHGQQHLAGGGGLHDLDLPIEDHERPVALISFGKQKLSGRQSNLLRPYAQALQVLLG